MEAPGDRGDIIEYGRLIFRHVSIYPRQTRYSLDSGSLRTRLQKALVYNMRCFMRRQVVAVPPRRPFSWPGQASGDNLRRLGSSHLILTKCPGRPYGLARPQTWEAIKGCRPRASRTRGDHNNKKETQMQRRFRTHPDAAPFPLPSSLIIFISFIPTSQPFRRSRRQHIKLCAICRTHSGLSK